MFILLGGCITPLYAVSSSVVHTTQSDFQQGTVGNTLETNLSPGSISLKQNRNVLSDTLEEGLKAGSKVNIAPSDADLELSEFVHYSDEFFGYDIGIQGLNIWVNEINNVIYFSSYEGLFVIDQNNLNDISDDVVVAHYSSTSVPSLGADQVRHTYLDTVTGLLYVSAFGSGLKVIDTNDTLDMSDDVIVATYSPTSSPAISTSGVYHSYLDQTTDLLYISQNGGGLSVIDTKGTTTQIDDTLLITYRTTSSPSIAGNGVTHSVVDSANNLIYIVSFNAGLNVIDTKGTTSVADDERIFTYTSSSTPAITDNNMYHLTIDSANDLLYLSSRSGVDVIDRKGTVAPSDDELLVSYNTSSTPAIGSSSLTNPSWTYSTLLDSDEGMLYLSSPTYGIAIIDTHLTVDPSDDTIHRTYNWEDGIGNPDTYSLATYLDKNDSRLYINTFEGLFSVYLDGRKTKYGEYISKAKKISETPSDLLSLTSDLPANTTVGIQYRTADVNGVWEDNFNSNDVSYITDFYGWGAPFNSVETINGILTMDDPVDNKWATMWIDTGKADDYFPAGSMVRMKVRSNVGVDQSSEPFSYSDYLFTDEWEDGSSYYYTVNDWVYLTLIPTLPFSKIGVEPYIDPLSSYTWQPSDSYEIDWITVELPNSEWSSWNDICFNRYGCYIDPADLVGNEYIQYKLTLTTTNTSVTPSVTEVSFNSGYQPSGEYISKVIDGGRNTKWNEVVDSSTVPVGTSIVKYTRTGNSSTPNSTWSSWELVDGDSIVSPNGRYLQYKFVLSTTNEELTPIIQSVEINYDTDTYPPEGSVVIGGNAESTDWPYVWLTTIAQDDFSTVTSMRVCNNDTFTGCTWKNYNEGGYWALLAGTGVREVFAQYRDSEGNTSEVYSDTIELLESTSPDVNEDNGEGDGQVPDDTNSQSTFTILNSKIVDNILIVSEKRPTFSGKTYPNAIVKITINSKLIEGETVADSEGYWVWTPDEDLEEGDHKITINIIDGSNHYTDMYSMRVEGDNSPTKPVDSDTKDPNKDISEEDFSLSNLISNNIILLVVLGVAILSIITLVVIKGRKRVSEV